MAMVCLSNLFEEDKNFYGLLEPIKDLKVFVLPGKDFKYLAKDTQNEFFTSFNRAVPICDIFKNWLNSPEWKLNSKGYFINSTGGLYKIKDKLKFLELFKINVSGLLKEFVSKSDLLKIAELVSWEWRRDNMKGIKEFEYFKPRLNSKSYVVNLEKFNIFVKYIIEIE
jgi:hypothetical protein